MSEKNRCFCGAVGPPYNHFLDCSMSGLKFARVIVPGPGKTKKVTAKLDLQALVDEAVDMSLNENVKLVRQGESHLFNADILVAIPLANPWAVYNSSGEKVGAALVAFDGRGLMLHITLDKQTPEAFDIEVNPLNVQAMVTCSTLNDGTLTGSVTLKGL
jgi:hypothetical protein